jgi:hypothetical protein
MPLHYQSDYLVQVKFYIYLCILHLYLEKQNNKSYDKCFIDKFKKKRKKIL